MKKVLIYGDSNVWGDNFISGTRIPDENQWPNILKQSLGDEYIIFQEGLPGRLAGNEETIKTFKNGKDSFLSAFRTNAPLNQVIIMLGTNDLQVKYRKSANQIIKDLLWYYEIVLEEFKDNENKKKYFCKEKMPQFLFILPIPFDYKENAREIFDIESEKNRKLILEYFQNNHKEFECLMLEDVPLFEDGIHLNHEGHKIVAIRVEEKLKNE